MSWMLLKIMTIKDDNVKRRFIDAIKNLPMLKSYHCPDCYFDMSMMNTDIVCHGCIEEGKLLKEINDYMEQENQLVG